MCIKLEMFKMYKHANGKFNKQKFKRTSLRLYYEKYKLFLRKDKWVHKNKAERTC